MAICYRDLAGKVPDEGAAQFYIEVIQLRGEFEVVCREVMG